MPLPCQTARTALDLIGSTPVVRLNRMPQLEGVGAEVWAKLENLNPGGSVKDRICRAMVEAAERDERRADDDRKQGFRVARAQRPECGEREQKISERAGKDHRDAFN